MTDNRQEPVYIRQAWILLLLVSVLSLWIGYGDFTRAGDADPALVESISGIAWTQIQQEDPNIGNLIDLLSRLVGALWIGFSVFALIVSVTGYRKGERWAWFGLWSLPLVMLLIFVTFSTADLIEGAPTPPALFSAPGLFVIASIGLLLPIRKFFPKR